jgi:hypothetical protein
MNRSYSKIRHIQEANIRLEKRLLSEEPLSLVPDVNTGNSQTNMNPIDSASILMKWNKKDTIGLTKFLMDTKRGSVKSKVDKLQSIYDQDSNDDVKLKELGNIIYRDNELLSKIKEFADKNHLIY